MDWYAVVKTIKGQRYVYEQRTWREDGKVRTESRYLGREDREDRKKYEMRLAAALDAELMPFVGKAWRADTGFRMSKTSALDVVRYEEGELGNAVDYKHLSTDVRSALARIDSGYVVWVTRTKFDADRYGDAERFEVGQGARVIAEDSDGGYLVLLARKS